MHFWGDSTQLYLLSWDLLELVCTTYRTLLDCCSTGIDKFQYNDINITYLLKSNLNGIWRDFSRRV